MESSLPGMGYEIRFGSQSVSTIPTVAMAIFAQSIIAGCGI